MISKNQKKKKKFFFTIVPPSFIFIFTPFYKPIASDFFPIDCRLDPIKGEHFTQSVFLLMHVLLHLTQCDMTNNFLVSHILQFIYSTTKLRKKCSYSELFWSAFSHIRTEKLRIRTPFTQCKLCETKNMFAIACVVSVQASLLPTQNCISFGKG